ncbi:MAG: UbiA family prenyltransferase [Bradymonadaceae bacterium]|nr:UbiA family prenyltransferase [Lujinxingiaceae bacterium]
MSKPDKITKSVLTCDMEGRIETFSKGSEELFGYTADEAIGKLRVSAFSPGLVVLGHVGGWLKASVKNGTHETDTVFLRKDGTQFAAHIRIRPTFRNDVQIGYCGITHALEDRRPDEVMPKISIATRLLAALVVTRAPFLTAALVPVAIGAAWTAAQGTLASFPWALLAMVAVGAAALHVAANTFNDYFDWKSGTDQANTEYFQAFSGGSRSIELGLISLPGLWRLALGASIIATVIGAALVYLSGPGIVLFGLAGLLSAYFYTAPPLRLVARKGLGELLIGLNFGPLIVGGTVYALTGSVSALDFAIGLPIGLLTTAILWINEFPDAPSDASTGKNHLVVVLGRERARWGYALILAVAFGLTLAAALSGVVPTGVLLAMLAAPMAIDATRTLFRHVNDRQLVRACVTTIQLHLVAGVLMTVGMFWGGI